MPLFALFRLGFPPAPGLLSLNLATCGNSQAHSTKGTPSPSRALTACRSTVSGSLSLPSRGPFHLSLTVLYYALSVAAEYSALEGGPPCFRQDSSCPAVLRIAFHAGSSTSPTGISPSLSGLPRPFGCQRAFSPHGVAPRTRPTTPRMACTRGLGSSLFARRYWGNLV